MSKLNKFLSIENQNELIKKMYQFHIKDGGKMSVTMFKIQIPELMNHWKRLDSLDCYESLVYSELDDEINYINKLFMNDYKMMYETGAENTTLTPTHIMMPEDYGKLDIARSNKDTLDISWDNYRSNKINIDKTSRHIRNYDRSNEGYTGRSIETQIGQKYDMSEFIDNVEKPYQDIDDLDVPYYGQVSVQRT